MRRWSLIFVPFLVGGCVVPAATPSSSPPPSPTQSASPSPTASPSPSPTAASGMYTNFALGYRIDLPAPWRRSACLSSEEQAQLLAGDGFVRVSEQDERGTDIGYIFDVVRVSAEANPDRLTPERWVAAGKIGSTQGQTAQAAALDGRAALLVRPSASLALSYVLAVADRMFVVGYQNAYNDSSNVATMERMVRSFHVLTEQERSAAPSPAPTVPRSAEAVADTLANGFARMDPDLLTTVMAPCMAAALEQAGGTFTPRSALANQLRDGFAGGLRVSAERRPIEIDATGTFVRATWTQPGVPTQRRDLYVRAIGDVWSWYLTLTRQPAR
jgi:hypothetical protein